MSTDGPNGRAYSALCSADELVNHGEYDYVIVGGGTAGLCVAARLTENEPKASTGTSASVIVRTVAPAASKLATVGASDVTAMRSVEPNAPLKS